MRKMWEKWNNRGRGSELEIEIGGIENNKGCRYRMIDQSSACVNDTQNPSCKKKKQR